MAVRDKNVQLLDEDTVQEVYTDKIAMYIKLFLEDNNLETIDNQFHWNACLRYLYKHIFKPDHNLRDNRKCAIPYEDIDTFNNIFDIYIDYCNLYKRNPTMYGYMLLTGLSKQGLYNLINGSDNLSLQWIDLYKKFEDVGQQALDNRLFDSNNVTGQLGLANHYYGYNLPGVSKERSTENRSLSDSKAAFDSFKLSGTSQNVKQIEQND